MSRSFTKLPFMLVAIAMIAASMGCSYTGTGPDVEDAIFSVKIVNSGSTTAFFFDNAPGAVSPSVYVELKPGQAVVSAAQYGGNDGDTFTFHVVDGNKKTVGTATCTLRNATEITLAYRVVKFNLDQNTVHCELWGD
jgi:hypothetical protein